MNKKFTITLLYCMCLAYNTQAFDPEFFHDIENSFHKMRNRMEQGMSSFFDSATDGLDIALEEVQKGIDDIREDLKTTTSGKSSHAQLLTIENKNDITRITLSIGNIETDMIENHLENNALVITLPKDKPSLRITIYPDTITVAGEKLAEKKHTADDDSTSSYAVSSRSFYIEKPLPITVITTQNVTILHSADDKTLTIELPQKIHKQQFAIQKK